MTEKNHTAVRLRIGIMVNSLTTPRWVTKIVQDIQQSSFAQIVLVIRNDAPRAPRPKSLRERLKIYWTHSLFERYRQWDRERHRVTPDAFEEIDLTEALKGAPILAVRPIQKGFVDRVGPEDLEKIQQAKLDVLFRFGFRIIRGGILSSAKYGVWSFHHGDNREYRGAPPGFWEIFERNPITGSVLQVLTESLDGGRVIYRSFSASDFRSLYLSLNQMYWKTAEFAVRRLRHLHRYGWSYIESLDEYNEPSSYKKPIYRTPAAPIMVRFLARLCAQKIYQRCRGLFFTERTQWFMAYRTRNNSHTALNDRRDLKVIVSPTNRFYADPFLIHRNSAAHLFFEDFDFSKNRASISCMELGKDGQLGHPRTALERDYHLSYPFVFEHAGVVYMIPETRERRTIELYRAEQFPHSWALLKILAADVLAVDSTIFQSNGKFWLFTNMAVPGASTFDELSLFFADSLEGVWTPHPQNPIVSDVRSARPAGSLFYEDKKLIRPGQDCSHRYGYAISFNEVIVLSESEYKERPYARIEPDWYPGAVCTHTYNRSQQFEVLDAMVIKRLPRFNPARSKWGI